jgi:hypothetical protein
MREDKEQKEQRREEEDICAREMRGKLKLHRDDTNVNESERMMVRETRRILTHSTRAFAPCICYTAIQSCGRTPRNPICL